MKDSMLDVTKGLIYDLIDEMNSISCKDTEGVMKFNKISCKLSFIENYVNLMLEETNYDTFKDLKMRVNDASETLSRLLAYHNGYQQALIDIKKNK